MKHISKLIFVTALSVVAFGCGGETGGADAGGSKPDGSSTCAASKKCGDKCCGASQECVSGTCTDCECTTESWACGEDSCGNTCGTCTSPKTCNTSSHTCTGGSACTAASCTGETPTCNSTSGNCECTANSCGTGKTCDATSKTCVVTGGCTASQTSCNGDCCENATEKCVNNACATCGCGTRTCGTDACGTSCGAACGTGKVCNQTGTCVDTAQACTGVTCAMAGETCDTADGQCHCTVGGTACASGYQCDATLRKCIPVAVACAGKSCTAEQPCNTTTDNCECTTASCSAVGKTCNTTTKACESAGACAGKTCTAEQPCNSSTNNCECTSASCAAVGKTCNSATKACEGTGCSSCTSGETCNSSTNSCECKVATGTTKDTCADATSSAFVCDGTTKRCKSAAVTCNGTTCKPGQVCADPNVADPMTGPNKVCTCVPSYQNTAGAEVTDTCLYLGQACNYYTDAPWECAKPSFLDECTQWAGCDTTYAPYSCEFVGNQFYACVQKCTATSECGGLTQTCQQGYLAASAKMCYYNTCARNATSGAPDRAKYFTSCAANGAGDGLCLPLPGYDTSNNPLDKGYCFQTGTATEGSVCDPFGSRADLTKVCGQNLFCDFVQATQSGTDWTLSGICRPICNAAEGTPTPVKACSGANQKCVNNMWYFWIQGYDPTNFATDYTYALLGQCEGGCDVLTGSPACTSPDALGNTMGCTLFDYSGASGAGYCEAQQPAAGAAGAQCYNTATSELVNDDGSLRKQCSGSLFCDYNGTGKCTGFCSTTTCASGACSMCTPNTMTCAAAGTGTLLGVCQ